MTPAASILVPTLSLYGLRIGSPHIIRSTTNIGSITTLNTNLINTFALYDMNKEIRYIYAGEWGPFNFNF